MFFCLLKAVRGGSLKTSANLGSWLRIDLQCFNWMDGTEGNLGSQVTAKNGLLVCSIGATIFFKACVLVMDLVFCMAPSINPAGYSLSIKKSFSSRNLKFLCSSSEHILTILKARENGIFCVVWFGW